MPKPTILCPHCQAQSTYEVHVSIGESKIKKFPNTYHEIIRCDVCDNLIYVIYDVQWVDSQTYIPRRFKRVDKFQYPFGNALKPIGNFPANIKAYYEEAYDCFNIGCLRASASMCRATISAICDDFKIEGSDLKTRINKLALSNRLIEVAKSIKWVGDRTLHNQVDWSRAKWNKDTIYSMLQFIDRIIDDLYTQEQKAKQLNILVSKGYQNKQKQIEKPFAKPSP